MSEALETKLEEKTAELEEAGTTSTKKKQKKLFTRDEIKTSVSVMIHLPNLYPDYEPWGFKLKLKLSGKAEEGRQKWLALSAAKRLEQTADRCLDEICDLLIELPTGFGDLKDTGQGPGHSFRSYVETASGQAREMLDIIVEAADSVYWNSISPYEFHPTV